MTGPKVKRYGLVVAVAVAGTAVGLSGCAASPTTDDRPRPTVEQWQANPILCHEREAILLDPDTYQATGSLPDTTCSGSFMSPSNSLNRKWVFSPDYERLIALHEAKPRTSEREAGYVDVATGTWHSCGFSIPATQHYVDRDAYFLADGRMVFQIRANATAEDTQTMITDPTCSSPPVQYEGSITTLRMLGSDTNDKPVDVPTQPEKIALDDNGWPTNPVVVAWQGSHFGPRLVLAVASNGEAITFDPIRMNDDDNPKLRTKASRCTMLEPRRWACIGIVPKTMTRLDSIANVQLSPNYQDWENLKTVYVSDEPETQYMYAIIQHPRTEKLLFFGNDDRMYEIDPGQKHPVPQRVGDLSLDQKRVSWVQFP